MAGLLLLSLFLLPVHRPFREALSPFIPSFFASLPLFIYILFAPALSHPAGLIRGAGTSIALIFLAPLLGPVPGLAVILLLLFFNVALSFRFCLGIYSDGEAPLRHRLFTLMAAQYVLALGFLIDCLLLGRLEELPLFTLWGLGWGVALSARLGRAGEDAGPGPGEGVSLVLVPLLAVIAMAAFRLTESYCLTGADPSFFEKSRLLIAAGMAAVAAALYYPGEKLLEGLWADSLRRFAMPLRRMISSLKEEKMSLASDIHDTVAQEIYAARLGVQMVERNLKEDPPRTAGELKSLETAVTQALQHSRSIIEKLSREEGDSPEEEGEDLAGLIDRVGRERGIRFRLFGLELLAEMEDRGAAGELSMIIREAVNNVRKHSGAGNGVVRVKKAGGRLRLLVMDDGQGFDTNAVRQPQSFGLSSMERRCRRIGGSLIIRTNPKKGTRILVSCPL
jgi:signal transduction histidine kinase